MIIFLFGLPGVGKNFVGEWLQKEYGFYFYDADIDLTPEMKNAIQKKEIYTEEMRDDYYKKLIASIKNLKAHHEKLVVGQGLSKNKHRLWLKEAFPELQFYWVQADDIIREARLLKRQSALPISPEYAARIKQHFEIPNFDHQVIVNDTDEEALQVIFAKKYFKIF